VYPPLREAGEMQMKQVMLLTHGDVDVAAGSLGETLDFLALRKVAAIAPTSEWEKHGRLFELKSVELAERREDLQNAELCLVLGGDGTMLRAFHLTRGLGIPVAGVNLGRVGFLTTLMPDELDTGLARLLDGDYVVYPLLGLEASTNTETFNAANDIAVGRGERTHAAELSLRINGVTLFEVLCDGVVAGTPAGSSAYSLAAGGPLLGISVDAYVISLVAPHLVGVRPVVAAPADVLEITNIAKDSDCYVDIDGQRMASLAPSETLIVKTTPAGASLALLEGDSLYHHFRDRLL
jgi:NAD+ kinase